MTQELFVVKRPGYYLHGKAFRGERVTLTCDRSFWGERPKTGGGGGSVDVECFVVRRSRDPQFAFKRISNHGRGTGNAHIPEMPDGLPAVFAIPVANATALSTSEAKAFEAARMLDGAVA